MHKLIFIFLLSLFLAPASFSQMMSPSVIASGGGFGESSSGSISYTFGETFINSWMISGFSLSEGFQQGWMLRDSSPDVMFGFEVLPNPVTDKLRIRIYESIPQQYTATVYSVIGKLFYNALMEFTEYGNPNYIDFSEFPMGIYFLRLISADKKIIRTFKLEKL